MATIPKYSIAFSDRVGLQEGPKSGPASDTVIYQHNSQQAIGTGATGNYDFSFMVDDRVGDIGKIVAFGFYIYKPQNLGAEDWFATGAVNLTTAQVDIGTPVGGTLVDVTNKGSNVTALAWTNLYTQSTITNTGNIGTTIDVLDRFAYFEANLISHGASFVTAANVITHRAIIRLHCQIVNNVAAVTVNPYIKGWVEALKYKL